jgi:orotidine-5'-phosphate decarboxylase
MKCAPLKNPLILALDVDDENKAWELVEETSPFIGGIKIGPRIMLRFGPQFLKKVAAKSPVFLDMKFFDIPSTMVAAVRSAFDIGATLVTVHAQAGCEALNELAKLEQEYRKTMDVKILSVTILTSFDRKSLPTIVKDQSIDRHVEELANLVSQSGLTGIVCSPHELSALAKYQGLYLVTPGIRTDLSSDEDQKRVMGPREALQQGATAIVVGRPILTAASPVEKCQEILKSLRS